MKVQKPFSVPQFSYSSFSYPPSPLCLGFLFLPYVDILNHGPIEKIKLIFCFKTEKIKLILGTN